jgi:flagellar P-ring protein FlgI
MLSKQLCLETEDAMSQSGLRIHQSDLQGSRATLSPLVRLGKRAFTVSLRLTRRTLLRLSWAFWLLACGPTGWAVEPVTPVDAPHLARVKDIASIEGIRDNQLVGYGIVVGLHNTGDSQQTAFPLQTLAATLLRMGVSVPASSIKVQNLAAVFISATLPPFSRPGTKLDVTVASAGDAQSLEGGLLLLTPLYGPDGKIYAEGEGPLVVGGYALSVNGNVKSYNHPTTARIPSGAIVERGLTFELTGRHNFTLLLNQADFRSAGAMATYINKDLGREAARSVDSREIDLEVTPGEDIPSLLARVEAVEVPFYPTAKVVVNERTGTVVIGGTVVLQPVSILHGGLAINVVSEFQVSQPSPFSNTGTTQVVQQTQIQVKDKPVNRIELKKGSTVDDLVRSLQSIGATARDVISILQAMKSAGALEAEIEVL